MLLLLWEEPWLFLCLLQSFLKRTCQDSTRCSHLAGERVFRKLIYFCFSSFPFFFPGISLLSVRLCCLSGSLETVLVNDMLQYSKINLYESFVAAPTPQYFYQVSSFSCIFLFWSETQQWWSLFLPAEVLNLIRIKLTVVFWAKLSSLLRVHPSLKKL